MRKIRHRDKRYKKALRTRKRLIEEIERSIFSDGYYEYIHNCDFNSVV